MSNLAHEGGIHNTPELIRHFSMKNDELDLLELLAILLKRKKTIIALTFLAIIAGIAYSSTLAPRWTSSAVIVPPAAKELRTMDKTITQLAILGIDTQITPDSLLSDFMRNFDSRDLREKYLVNTNYFKQLIQDKPGAAEDPSRLIDSILDGNIVSHSSGQDKADDKKEYRYYSVSYTAENPVAARDLLEGYINYVTQVVEDELHQKISYQVDLLKGKAEGQYQLDLARAENARQVKLERLRYALSIANSAGLKKPSWSNGTTIQDDPDFSVTLGADGLSRKLEIERSLRDVSQLSPDLLNRKMVIDKLNALKINEMEILPFKYMRQPYQPLKKDKSKRVMLVALFAIAGLLGSCGYVLVDALMKRREEEKLSASF